MQEGDGETASPARLLGCRSDAAELERQWAELRARKELLDAAEREIAAGEPLRREREADCRRHEAERRAEAAERRALSAESILERSGLVPPSPKNSPLKPSPPEGVYSMGNAAVMCASQSQAAQSAVAVLKEELYLRDRNHDGHISLNEFRLFWRAVFPSRTQEEIVADTHVLAGMFGIAGNKDITIEALAQALWNFGRRAVDRTDRNWRQVLWLVVGSEDGQSCPGRLYRAVQHAAVITVCITMLLETYPDLNDWKDGTPSSDLAKHPPEPGLPEVLFWIEALCMGVFVADLLLLAISHPRGVRAMAADPHVWIDVVALVPFFVTLATAHASFGSSMMALRLFRTLRLLRAARVLKLGQGIGAFEMMVRAAIKARWSMFWLMLLLCMAMVISSTLIFYAELEGAAWNQTRNEWVSGSPGSEQTAVPFQSVPHAMWWSIVTLTTVGYGDLYPAQPWGRVVASATMVAGLFVIGFPTTVLTNSFSDVIAEARDTERMTQQAERLMIELQSRARRGAVGLHVHRKRTPEECHCLADTHLVQLRRLQRVRYFAKLRQYGLLRELRRLGKDKLAVGGAPEAPGPGADLARRESTVRAVVAAWLSSTARSYVTRTCFERFWSEQMPLSDAREAGVVFGELAGDPDATSAPAEEVLNGICSGGRESSGGVWRTRVRFDTDTGGSRSCSESIWYVVSGKGMVSGQTAAQQIPSMVYVAIGVLAILASVSITVVETLPELRDGDGQVNADAYEVLYAIETGCMVWFSLDLVLVGFSFPGGIGTLMRDPVAWVELATLVPMYIAAIADDRSSKQFTLNPLRMLRAIRVIRLARHSAGLHLLVEAIVRARSSLQWLLLFVMVAMLLSSVLVFYAELDQSHWEQGEWVRNNDSHHPDAGSTATFQSIPDAMWWSLVTLTTVGYGDQYPRTGPGKIIGSFTMLAGLVVIGFPMTILTNAFAEVREEWRCSREARNLLRKLAKTIKGRAAQAHNRVRSC